ncbi:hypothetical protein FRC07_001109 [Ceratobasidium sp. 392]|nr:hypothetical protein FRC07_001109 [Ceratobasidium sp. 392]
MNVYEKTIDTILTDTQNVFNGFAGYCADAGPARCAIAQNGTSADDILAWTLDLIKLAYDHTKTTGGTVITSGVLRGTYHQTVSVNSSHPSIAQIWAGMYRPSGWKAFAQFLRDTSGALRNSTIPTANSTLIKKAIIPRDILGLTPRAEPGDTDQSNPDLDFSAQAIVCSDSMDDSYVATQDVFNFEVNTTDKRSKLREWDYI